MQKNEQKINIFRAHQYRFVEPSKPIVGTSRIEKKGEGKLMFDSKCITIQSPLKILWKKRLSSWSYVAALKYNKNGIWKGYN